MAIVFGCIILATTVIGLALGSSGVAVAGSPSNTGPQSNAGPQVSTGPRLVLSTSPVKIGDYYSATAVGFSRGESVQFLWTGPTHGTMAAALPADPSGSTTLGGIKENDPPGNYTLIAIGQTSRRTAFTGLVVQHGN